MPLFIKEKKNVTWKKNKGGEGELPGWGGGAFVPMHLGSLLKHRGSDASRSETCSRRRCRSLTDSAAQTKSGSLLLSSQKNLERRHCKHDSGLSEHSPG